MDRRQNLSRALGMAGLLALLVGAVDPLEGFPLVLGGGVLAVIAARLARSRWFRPMAWGLGLATGGCAAMVVLSALGGIGGQSELPAAWGLTVLPYPIGGSLLLAGSELLLWQLLRARPASGLPHA
jgi:hypothetical protein